jgi:hypothetical protein
LSFYVQLAKCNLKYVNLVFTIFMQYTYTEFKRKKKS